MREHDAPFEYPIRGIAVRIERWWLTKFARRVCDGWPIVLCSCWVFDTRRGRMLSWCVLLGKSLLCPIITIVVLSF
jgi:hypothetical protein